MCPSKVRTSMHLHFISLRLLKYLLTDFIQIGICICTNNVSLGIVNGHIPIIHHRVLALVNVQKNGFWPLSFFTIWSIMMKLYKNDRNNKSSILANFVIRGYLPLPWGNIHVSNHEKIYVKSEFKAVHLKLTVNGQSDNSFL